MGKEYQGVWVFAEHRDRQLSRISLELLANGRLIADELGMELAAVLLGNDVKVSATELICYGADRVYLVQSRLLSRYQTSSCCGVMKQLILEHKPEIVLFGATALGRDLAPRLACALNIGLSAHCIDLKVDKPTRQLLQICPFFDFMVNIVSDTKPQMATVQPGIVKPLLKDGSRKGEVTEVSLEVPPPDVEVISVDKVEDKGAKIGEAEVVIGVGRGVKDLRPVQELAAVLGAEIGGTSPAVDEEMIPESCLIGQTGVAISPKLYIACGISGASQHTAGVRGSEIIVAINNDEGAPIFKIADYGIIGDVEKIVPSLTRYLKGGSIT